jgi:hypothetical protein
MPATANGNIMSASAMKQGLNFEAIGNLVKTWVLGEDRLEIPDPKYPGKNFTWPKPVSTTDPAAIQAIRDQFLRAGTLYTMPAEVTEVKVVQSSATCFVLKLPAPKAIKEQETWLKTHAYPTPPFYLSAVSAGPTAIADRLRLDASRIGDYTISNCMG